MPWQAQICPFCQKQYGNKTALRNHLNDYIGGLRLPADGIHDVLQIKQVLHDLFPSLHKSSDSRRYECRDCSALFDSRQQFQRHVYYRGHCGIYMGSEVYDAFIANPVPFFTERAVFIQKDMEPFPFLRLPYGMYSHVRMGAGSIYSIFLSFCFNVQIGLLAKNQ